MEIPAALVERYRRLFRFYDRNVDGVHTLDGDFQPVARQLDARWQRNPQPIPNLLARLLSVYAHESQRRDRDASESVDLQEFIDSHAPVIQAFQSLPEQARDFIALTAGGFFDVLDLDRDGVLQLSDLQAFAAAYEHPVEGIAANLDTMLAELGLPPGRLPRATFLTLVEQYWFDPSPNVPGRLLFGGVPLN
ncbi:MAG: EF-hand domain-containing protein [Synechococcaceae cyanobacterium]|nr:EF-hand domain-containing protein [Synechococcaceae cyanobacterium]